MKKLSNLKRHINTTIFTSIISLLILYSYNLQAAKPQPIIAISQFLTHKAVDDIYKGLIDELKNQGYMDGKTAKIISKNASGDVGTNVAIATYIKSINPTIAIGISTPSAQALAGIKSPLVFSSVTDPIDAKLVKSLSNPGQNITGVTDMPPFEEQIKLIKHLLPKAQLIAVPYCPGESNSVKQVETINTLAQKHGLKVLLLPVTSISQIKTALAKALDKKADAYLIPLDNMMASAIQTITSFAISKKIPLFSSNSLDVTNNRALASVGISYYDVGVKTGQTVARILKGEKPGDIPVSTPDKSNYYFNIETAKTLGIQIPEVLLKKAKKT